jgi:hypothetical protein
MNRTHLIRIIIGAIFLLAPATAIGIAWSRFRRIISDHPTAKWNSFPIPAASS